MLPDLPAVAPPSPGAAVDALRAALRTFASITRLHIVAIAGLGTFTFGWIFTGRYHWLLAAVTAGDWFLINLLNRAVDAREDEINAIPGARFAARHRRAISAGGVGLLLLSFPALHVVTPPITPFRLGTHLLGLAYNYPLRPGWRRLKQLYFWKNTASALGFMGTVFAYPLATAWTGSGFALAAGVTLETVGVAAAFFFLFELSYEVIYDLRDAPGDAAAGVRTYPVVHGARGATWIIDGLILSSLVVLGAGYAARVVPWRLFVMIAAPLFQLVYYKRAVRRGITAGHCITITWVGAALLLTYHIWWLLRLPGAGLR